MKRITVLGNFSGRNAGDNAILGNLLDDVAACVPGAKFLVPTLNAGFVRRHFQRHDVDAMGLMPWNGALKIFGLPTAKAMLDTDLVLITDNILFDRRFFNPAFNYLSTIALLAPKCKKRGIPICLYNASVGPIRTDRGARALQKILDASPVAILRDEASGQVIRDWKLRSPRIIQGADCALNTAGPSPERLQAILKRLGVDGPRGAALGFNVNTYVDSWKAQGGSFGRERFVALVAKVMDRLIDALDVDVVFFVTQVMDRHIIREIITASKRAQRVHVAANPDYTYEELAGIMSRLGLLVGMRTHSIILSCAVETPVVNLNAYPKTRAFLATLGMDRWSIEFEDLSEDRLFELVSAAWVQRESTRKLLAIEVEREKSKAKESAVVVAELLARGAAATR